MKEIYIIRHAESTSNAGERTENHHNVPLSEKGKMQAKELAETLKITPELIVVSSYQRTKDTAEPLIIKNPSVPVETWGVHEFTYLPPALYKGTTAKERFEKASEYWNNASVYHKESDESESFFELTERMRKLLVHLKSRAENKITIFSHGRFILGLQLYMNKVKEVGRDMLTELELHELKKEHAGGVMKVTEKFPIDNVSVHRIEI